MTNEELLKPRYKVIADYPSSAFNVGDILPGTCEYLVKGEGFCDDGYMQEYPHLFKKLEWWEERDENDLSEVKFAKTVAGNSVRTVLRFELYWNKIVLDGGKVRPIKNWLPATKEEYETQTNFKQNDQKSAQIKEI